jgi:glyoxylase-like metal-dependent hydrolase (beta-lactamase superfamily II)
MIFTGDTLFAGSVGRTDLPSGNEVVLSQSLKRLVALPDDTIVFPGHGPQSTIAREKKTNPFLMAL